MEGDTTIKGNEYMTFLEKKKLSGINIYQNPYLIEVLKGTAKIKQTKWLVYFIEIFGKVGKMIGKLFINNDIK